MIAGVDIGGTTTKIGLVLDGKVLVQTRISTTGYADDNAFADAIAAEIARLTSSNDQPTTAIGIGAPNANQHTGIIEMAPNLPWKHDVPLARMVQDRLGIHTVLGNDANAAALGEWKYGAGKGYKDLLIVTLGTGVGSGFIVNGQLVLGSHGNAGELGHMTLAIDGRQCTCGRKGCVETYVSIRGMRQTYLEMNGSEQVLERDGVLPIAEAARAGDVVALSTFERTVEWLAVALANAVAVTGPQRIVLFGGIARNGELIMAPLRDAFQKALLNVYMGRVDLTVSALPNDDAAILGAAALVEG